MKNTIFTDFFHSEKSSGFLLIGCTCISLLLSNLSFGNSYSEFWLIEFQGMTILQWINDGLMTIFFLLVGLELEREIFVGELSKFRQAMLPIAAAVGGIVVPALLFYAFNYQSDYEKGFGIAMATDIAFSLTILSLLSSRVPFGLRVFLTALAIADDLGAIIVIAIFYSESISWIYLGLAFLLFGTMYLMGKMKVYVLWPYILGGILMWYCTHHSGIHATISGVLLAFAIPFGKSDDSPSFKLQSFLHIPVGFIILPLFALANTCIRIEGIGLEDLMHVGVYGVLAGLVIGKPLGIYLFTLASHKLGGLDLPTGVKLKHILGAGIVAGIGFTMSIFITDLAFTDEMYIKQFKLSILIGAIISSGLGFVYFYLFVPKHHHVNEK